MANISGYLNNIKSAGRGEDVRDSIINALSAINSDNPSKIKPLNVTANGTYTGDGGIVYNPITVNVPEGAASALTLKDINITENGEYEVDDGEAYRSITVDVPQYVNEILPEKVISSNGEYTALLDGYDGYGKVTVKVESGGTGTYTVKFFAADRTTVLQTVVNVPYGGGAVYKGANPTSTGMRFVGWTPNPLSITGDTNCYPRFEDPIIDDSLITDDWVTIAQKVRTNPDAYNIGQWKLMDLHGKFVSDKDDTFYYIFDYDNHAWQQVKHSDDSVYSSGELYWVIKVRLIGKMHDVLEGENGYAPTTWAMCFEGNYNDNKGIINNNWCVGGTSSDAQKSINWDTSNVRAKLGGEFYKNNFPVELQPYLRRVVKYTAYYSSSQLVYTDHPTIDWIFPPSVTECVGNDGAAEFNCKQYNYFDNPNSIRQNYISGTGLRTPYLYNYWTGVGSNPGHQSTGTDRVQTLTTTYNVNTGENAYNHYNYAMTKTSNYNHRTLLFCL